MSPQEVFTQLSLWIVRFLFNLLFYFYLWACVVPDPDQYPEYEYRSTKLLNMYGSNLDPDPQNWLESSWSGKAELKYQTLFSL